MADLENLYTLARRAANEGNSENARKYYEQIVEQAPNDWEAYYYSVYYQVSSCRIAEIASASYKITNAFMTTWDMIPEEKSMERTTLSLKTVSLLTNFFNASMNHYGKFLTVDSAKEEFSVRKKAFLDCVCSIANKNYENNIKMNAEMFYKQAYKSAKSVPVFNLPNESTIVSRIEELDPNFTVQSTTSSSGSSGGCYVATAVYGSYDCPQVWTLRRYRDYKLAKTWHGRAFIRTYYAISPTLVKWFGHTGWFRKMWKGKLDKMVSDLNKEGFENTPYEDIIW